MFPLSRQRPRNKGTDQFKIQDKEDGWLHIGKNRKNICLMLVLGIGLPPNHSTTFIDISSLEQVLLRGRKTFSIPL